MTRRDTYAGHIAACRDELSRLSADRFPARIAGLNAEIAALDFARKEQGKRLTDKVVFHTMSPAAAAMFARAGVTVHI